MGSTRRCLAIAISGFFLTTIQIANAAQLRQRTVVMAAAVPFDNGKVEIDEYPIQLEPFHIVYHHHDRRRTNFEAMEEMEVLAATRQYLSTVLSNEMETHLAASGNKFQRLLLYLFVRQEDETQTKVAYSGTAFLDNPTPPLLRQQIKDATWLSFLGANKTDYLTTLTRRNILDIDSITLLNVGGAVVGVSPQTGKLVSIDASTNTAGDDYASNFNNSDSKPANTQKDAPDTSMNSSVSMTLYLCAIIIPIVVFTVLIVWWVARKLKHDVRWNPTPGTEHPEGRMWQASQKLEERARWASASADSITSNFSHRSRHSIDNNLNNNNKNALPVGTFQVSPKERTLPQVDDDTLNSEERVPLKKISRAKVMSEVSRSQKQQKKRTSKSQETQKQNDAPSAASPPPPPRSDPPGWKLQKEEPKFKDTREGDSSDGSKKQKASKAKTTTALRKQNTTTPVEKNGRIVEDPIPRNMKKTKRATTAKSTSLEKKQSATHDRPNSNNHFVKRKSDSNTKKKPTQKPLLQARADTTAARSGRVKL